MFYCNSYNYKSKVKVMICYYLGTLNLSPPSAIACDGEQVVFTCTVNQTFVNWDIFTPRGNYTAINIDSDDIDMELRLAGGVFIFRVTSYTPSPLELVATVTVSVSQNLNGTLVECVSLISGVARKETSVLTLAGKTSN